MVQVAMPVTHLAYSDESQQNIGRFHAIGMVSLKAECAKQISDDIQNILSESEVREAKWQKIKGARDRFAAIKIFDLCLSEACKNILRIDVLIWDTNDSRHKIVRRDDNKNFINMYIQLFRNVFRKRWPNNSTWQVFPDENSVIDWAYIRNTLANQNRFTNEKELLFPKEWFKLNTDFGICEIVGIDSKNNYLAQAADLFAGMGVFSYEHYDIYKKWEILNPAQPKLFNIESSSTLSSKEEEHSCVMNTFLSRAQNHHMGISIKSNGLSTHNPLKPINFWLYTSKRPNDKAPIRIKK